MNEPAHSTGSAVDYRAFVFVVHHAHGVLLLHCTRKVKKGKPPHFQIPGGHVDAADFSQAAEEASGGEFDAILQRACQVGVARELFEETGIDVRTDYSVNRATAANPVSSSSRLIPASLRNVRPRVKKGNRKLLFNEYENRLFYFLTVTDIDFPTQQELSSPMDENGSHLKVRAVIYSRSRDE
jgi:8-oxo-dGTP pyrophosphatase MutT (NUDIX family)